MELTFYQFTCCAVAFGLFFLGLKNEVFRRASLRLPTTLPYKLSGEYKIGFYQKPIKSPKQIRKLTDEEIVYLLQPVINKFAYDCRRIEHYSHYPHYPDDWGDNLMTKEELGAEIVKLLREAQKQRKI